MHVHRAIIDIVIAVGDGFNKLFPRPDSPACAREAFKQIEFNGRQVEGLIAERGHACIGIET
jgi:hypothetical protein